MGNAVALKEKFFARSPLIIQELMVSLYNFKSNKIRYGGNYEAYFKKFKQNENLSLDELKEIQYNELKKLLFFAKSESNFYQQLFKNIDLHSIKSTEDLDTLPIVNKEALRSSNKDLYTIDKNKGEVGKTGGTTGKSLEVVYTFDNMQERFAMLDHFRSSHGYKLGKKTAWFSGKQLLNDRDIIKNRFWKTDRLYHVRYYSTFHLKDEYLNFYLQNLIEFAPEFIVGFPSSILEIAKYGIKHNYDFPPHTIKAIFPTAETVTTEMRAILESFFKTKVFNQYASSEGAPFIIECKKNKLHLELQSGVFEVLDHQNRPAKKGKLVVTSFTSYGSPLIRYDIGDSIELSDDVCNCGNNNPLVKEILGRIDDYVYSPQNGKINLGNVSNTLKDTTGIVKMQAVQEELNSLLIKLVVDKSEYTPQIEKIFLKNWCDRVGQNMKIELMYVDDIAVEKSGKYRMVKNTIKHLVDN